MLPAPARSLAPAAASTYAREAGISPDTRGASSLSFKIDVRGCAKSVPPHAVLSAYRHAPALPHAYHSGAIKCRRIACSHTSLLMLPCLAVSFKAQLLHRGVGLKRDLRPLLKNLLHQKHNYLLFTDRNSHRTCWDECCK